MIMQRFLVPLDLSEPALRALDYAVELGRQLQAHLTLLYVVQSIPEVDQDASPTGLQDHLARLEAELTRDMDIHLKRVREAGLEGDLIISHGIPYLETIEVATKGGIDLIVMGSHGRTGLRHLLLGSMAERVLRLAPCPVLIVR